MTKGYKIRLYPTEAQKERIKAHINACRFIWNYMIDAQTEAYKSNQKRLSRFDMIYMLKPLKKKEEYKWLTDVSNQSLVRTCTDLDKAYRYYFEKINKGLPKYKSSKLLSVYILFAVISFT